MSERIRTIARSDSHELEVKKSRFICTLERVATEDEAKAFIAERTQIDEIFDKARKVLMRHAQRAGVRLAG